VTRLTQRCTAALLSSALIGCSAAADAGSGGADTSAVAEVRARSAIATPEWEREITDRTGYPIEPVAFRAGGGIASLLHGRPLMHWMLLLSDSGHLAAGGPVRRWPGDSRAPIAAASDIAGISATGRSWYLDPPTGRVTDEDVGGYRAVIASLGARGTIRTACALGERAIAYLDVGRPDTIFVRDLDSPAPTRALPLPTDFAVVHEVPWDALRFGGAPDAPCVLAAPRLRGLLVITDSAVRAIERFVEPVPPAKRDAWYAPLARLVSRGKAADADSAAAPGALDATGVPGGVAVLFGGRTNEAGRVVDFYDATGAYLTTMRLPHRALRIAASHGRLYVLRQQWDPHDGYTGRVYVASYVLPTRVRGGGVLPDVPPVTAPAGHGTRRAPSADSANAR
jgi:hypothetical protein